MNVSGQKSVTKPHCVSVGVQTTEEFLLFEGHPLSPAVQRCVSPKEDLGCCQQVRKLFKYAAELFYTELTEFCQMNHWVTVFRAQSEVREFHNPLLAYTELLIFMPSCSRWKLTLQKQSCLNRLNMFWFQGKHGYLWPPVWDFPWWKLCANQQRDPCGGKYLWFWDKHACGTMWTNALPK